MAKRKAVPGATSGPAKPSVASEGDESQENQKVINDGSHENQPILHDERQQTIDHLLPDNGSSEIGQQAQDDKKPDVKTATAESVSPPAHEINEVVNSIVTKASVRRADILGLQARLAARGLPPALLARLDEAVTQILSVSDFIKTNELRGVEALVMASADEMKNHAAVVIAHVLGIAGDPSPATSARIENFINIMLKQDGN